MPTAAVKFVQGANVGTPGVALFGVAGVGVVVSNGTAAARYKFEVLDAPAASSVMVGTVQDGTAPTWGFTPDATGGYLVRLTVTDSSGGTAADERQFGVPEPSGRFVPAFKARGLASNFGNILRGWATYLERFLRFVDGVAAKEDATEGVINSLVSTVSGESVYSVRLSANVTLNGIAAGYPGRRLFVYFDGGGTISNASGSAAANDQILTGSGSDVTTSAGAVALFAWQTGNWRLIAGGGGGGGPIPGTNGQMIYNDTGALQGTNVVKVLGAGVLGIGSSGGDTVTVHANYNRFLPGFADIESSTGGENASYSATINIVTTDATPTQIVGIFVAGVDGVGVKIIVELLATHDESGTTKNCDVACRAIVGRSPSGNFVLLESLPTDVEMFDGTVVGGVAAVAVDANSISVQVTGIAGKNVSFTGSAFVVVNRIPA